MITKKINKEIENKFPMAFNYIKLVELPWEIRGQADRYALQYNHSDSLKEWEEKGCIPQESRAAAHYWMDSKGYPALNRGKYSIHFNQSAEEVEEVASQLEAMLKSLANGYDPRKEFHAAMEVFKALSVGYSVKGYGKIVGLEEPNPDMWDGDFRYSPAIGYYGTATFICHTGKVSQMDLTKLGL